ncbi:MAG TPA: Grx4 family monothiol glutaredoxin [Gammaproteobacteria bacterium]|nr:Grx4 family monothiol glutaredoxin [Gammaproteobacteria bacterium]
MDIHEKIKQQIAGNPVLLYMKGTPDFPQCGFSAQTVQALKQCDAEFAYVNILEEPEIRSTLKEVSNWPTFPQLFVKGELVGGCDIVTELYQSGELKTLVQGAARKAAS